MLVGSEERNSGVGRHAAAAPPPTLAAAVASRDIPAVGCTPPSTKAVADPMAGRRRAADRTESKPGDVLRGKERKHGAFSLTAGFSRSLPDFLTFRGEKAEASNV